MPGRGGALAPLVAPEGLQVFDVGAENAGERLDRFLGQAAAARRIALSRTRLKALIEAGEVRIDDSVARDPSTRLAAGARIAFEAPPPEEFAPRRRGHPACRRLRGRASDRDRQAGGARRPSGAWPCGWHAGQRADPPLRGELVGNRRGQAARNRAPARQGHVGTAGRRQNGCRASGPGRPLCRPWPHRLARSANIWRSSGAASMRPPARSCAPIGRDPRHREKMAVVSEERGRHATTHWRLEEDLGPASLIACQLETGRTHQIRVHMASIGHPLLGDSVYGSGFKTKAALLGDPRRVGARRSRTTGPPRLRPGFRTSRDRRDAPLREPAAERFCEVAQSITSYAGGLTFFIELKRP